MPRGVRAVLRDHVVEEARAHGWDTLPNGELLDAAEAAGVDVFVTTDRNLPYQQIVTGRRMAVVVLSTTRWRLMRHGLMDDSSSFGRNRAKALAPGKTDLSLSRPG